MRRPMLLSIALAVLALLAPTAQAKNIWQKILDKHVSAVEKTQKQFAETFEKAIKAQKKLPAGDPLVDLAAKSLAQQARDQLRLLRNDIRNRICSAAESLELQAQVTNTPIPTTYLGGRNGKWDAFVRKMNQKLDKLRKKLQKELDEFAKFAKKKWQRAMSFSLPRVKLGPTGSPGFDCPSDYPKHRAHAAVFDQGTVTVYGDADVQNVQVSLFDGTQTIAQQQVAVTDGLFEAEFTDIPPAALEVWLLDPGDACAIPWFYAIALLP